MARLIGLTGPARCGKSTVAEILDGHGFYVLSFADALKDGVATMLAALGDDVLEHLADPERKEVELDGLGVSPRYLWQTLGTEWGRERVHRDLWLKIVAAKIDRARRRDWVPDICIPDVRFVNEARWVLAQPGGEVWRIVRPGFENRVRAHESEAGVPPALISQGVVNDGDIPALAERLKELLA
jgi:hypothetical protein